MNVAGSKTPFEIPVRRDLEFRFDGTPAHHFDGNPYTSHFWNAISILAPKTEAFLIRAMKQARPKVTDPELRKQMDAFLVQEGLHSYHHNALNARLASLGYDVTRAGELAERELRALTDRNDVRGALSLVIAGEYAIYILAKSVLENPALLASTAPEVRRLIEWHAIEEMEHQSVACEVYDHLYGIRTADRLRHARALVKASRTLVHATKKIEAVLLANDPAVRSGARRDHLRYLFASPGLAWRVAAKLPRFLTPGFSHWSDAADLALIDRGLDRIAIPRSS